MGLAVVMTPVTMPVHSSVLSGCVGKGRRFELSGKRLQWITGPGANVRDHCTQGISCLKRPITPPTPT
jgi:hypothetical protein